MVFEQLFHNVSSKERSEAVEGLITSSTPTHEFFLMATLSVLMATFGLLADSSAVVVGSMLIAPVLYPMLSLSMGVSMSDFVLVGKSLKTIGKIVIMAIGVSALVTLIFAPGLDGYTSEILNRTKPSLLYAFIGAVAGFAASFALVKPKLNETLPGVAVAVALVPPLAVAGIGLAKLDGAVFYNAFMLFISNAAGVVITASVVFSLMNFYTKKDVAKEVIKEEDKKLAKANEAPKEIK